MLVQKRIISNLYAIISFRSIQIEIGHIDCYFGTDIFFSFRFFFSPTEITHRFQTARSEVRALLLQCLLPWLENVELVASSVPPATPLSYIMVRAAVKKYENGFCCFIVHETAITACIADISTFS